ncbi:hypothetical protein ACEPAI_7622 [Sanghuangporus weigelae]
MFVTSFKLKYDGREGPERGRNLLNALEAVIQRNKDSPLRFYAEIWFNAESDNDCTIASQLVATLLLHQNRWWHVHLDLSLTVSSDVLFLDMVNMPMLVSFTGDFSVKFVDGRWHKPRIDITNSSHLKHLDLEGDYLLQHGGGQIASLKILALGNLAENPGIATTALANLTLPAVERLDLYSPLPLDDSDVTIDPVLLSVIMRSHPPLTHLEIFGRDSDEDQLPEMLTLLPALQRLRILACQEAEWLFDALNVDEPSDDIIRCPQLRSLCLDGWYIDFGDENIHMNEAVALCEMVTSRWRMFRTFEKTLINDRYTLDAQGALSVAAAEAVRDHTFVCNGYYLNKLIVLAEEDNDEDVVGNWPLAIDSDGRAGRAGRSINSLCRQLESSCNLGDATE